LGVKTVNFIYDNTKTFLEKGVVKPFNNIWIQPQIEASKHEQRFTEKTLKGPMLRDAQNVAALIHFIHSSAFYLVDSNKNLLIELLSIYLNYMTYGLVGRNSWKNVKNSLSALYIGRSFVKAQKLMSPSNKIRKKKKTCY